MVIDNDDELYSQLQQQKQTHTRRISERQTSTYKRDIDNVLIFIHLGHVFG